MQPVTLAKPSEATVPDTLPFVANYSAKEQAIGAVRASTDRRDASRAFWNGSCCPGWSASLPRPMRTWKLADGTQSS